MAFGIGWKIEKDKGSKYYINEKEVRARDVQTLFADLSTGAHSPSLISQGKIGQIVTSKPIERKALEKKIANKKIIDFHIGNKKLRFDLPSKKETHFHASYLDLNQQTLKLKILQKKWWRNPLKKGN